VPSACVATETYRVRLPALKLSGLAQRHPGATASLVRSAVIECAATGLTAKLRFVPFRPLKDALRTVVLGHLGPTAANAASVAARVALPRAMPAAAAAAPAPAVTTLPRRRSGEGTLAGGSGSGGLAGLGRRIRRTFSGRILEEPAIEEDASRGSSSSAASGGGSFTGASLQRSPAEDDSTTGAASALRIFGLWDGKVFAEAVGGAPVAVAAPVARAGGLPAGPSAAGLPRRPSLSAPPASATPPPAPQLVYDDTAHVATAPLTRAEEADAITAALRSPASMVQAQLWGAVADALRGAVRTGSCGGNPVVRENLWAWLQPEGPQVTAAKKVPGARQSQEYAASWIVATLPNTHLPPALGQPRQARRAIMPAAAAAALVEYEQSEGEEA
jgi:hypothetical protein